MVDNVEIFHEVAERLSKITAPRNRIFSITGDTEIYRDPGIYGDEIVDLVWWLEREFGVKTNINPFKCAPHESPFFQASRAMRRLIGLEPQYERLTVRDILAAIEAKRWSDEARAHIRRISP
jgi:hypothetical protein